jgi:hypothetical protein
MENVSFEVAYQKDLEGIVAKPEELTISLHRNTDVLAQAEEPRLLAASWQR